MGQYQNLEVTDEVNDIPDNLALDEDFISKLTQTMLLGLEITVNEYYKTRTEIRDADPDEVVTGLSNRRAELIANLQNKINPQ